MFKNKDYKIFSQYLQTIFLILPLFLILGILYQFYNLILIDKLLFFSWTQVINDTVSLFFPITFGIFGIYLGFLIKIDTFKNFFKDFFLISIIPLIFSILLYSQNIELLYKTLLIGYGVMLMGKSFLVFKIILGSEKLKNEINSKNLVIIYMIFSFFTVLYGIKDIQYKNLFIKIDNNKEKVIYMNDRYIITNELIIHNTDSIIFYNK